MMRQCCLLGLLLSVCAIPSQSDKKLLRLQVVHEWRDKSDLLGLAWSPDGERIATHSDWGRTYTIWTTDGKRERDFEQISDLPIYGNSLGFLRGGRWLLTQHVQDSQVKGMRIFTLWDVSQGTPIGDVPGPFPKKAIQFNGAFSFAVTRDESAVAVISSLLPGQPVTVYATDDWRILKQFSMGTDRMHSNGASSVAFSPDGKRLAIGRNDGTVELHDLDRKDASPAQVFTAYDRAKMIPVGALAFSPDGQFLAAGAGLTLDAYRSAPAFKFWSLGDGVLAASGLPGAEPVRQISWSKKGTYIAVAAGDRTVRLGSPLLHPKEGWVPVSFEKPVSSVAFSPNADLLAVASGQKLEILAIR